jgi:uncharacterized protein (DUF1499 family)
VSAIAPIALALAIGCAAAALIAGPGYRFDAWSLGVGFDVLRWAAYGAAAAALIACAGALLAWRGGRRGRVAQGVAALAIALATFGVPAFMLERAKASPAIHDVSTDTDDPPRFVAVLAARAGASNPAEYGGASVASQQHRAYPHIAPLDVDVAPDVAFGRALAAARDMDWTIVAAVADEGRIEATDTTPFFGFKDDVVVRVRARGAGSRIDVRSLSRIGTGDLGTNARRVAAYLARVSGER